MTSYELLDPAAQLEALHACIAESADTRRTIPPHPQTGCECDPCIARDMALENRAEQRASDRQWSSDRDADMAADRYYGDAS